MAWYYNPRAGGLRSGNVCWYCGRAWHAEYRCNPLYATIALFEAACGVNNDLRENLKRLVAFLIQKCIEAGIRQIRISFSEAPQEVVAVQRQGTSVSDYDLHIELEYYKTEWKGGKGDPQTNGLGHRTGWLDGTFGVFVPSAPIKKIKRTREGFVDITRKVDDGSMVLSEGQLERVSASVLEGFRIMVQLANMFQMRCR